MSLCAMTSVYLYSILQGLHFILGLYCIVIMLNAYLCYLKLIHKSCRPKLTSTKETVVMVVQSLSHIRLLRPHGLQPASLLCPWVLQARILEWVAISCSWQEIILFWLLFVTLQTSFPVVQTLCRELYLFSDEVQYFAEVLSTTVAALN